MNWNSEILFILLVVLEWYQINYSMKKKEVDQNKAYLNLFF